MHCILQYLRSDRKAAASVPLFFLSGQVDCKDDIIAIVPLCVARVRLCVVFNSMDSLRVSASDLSFLVFTLLFLFSFIVVFVLLLVLCSRWSLVDVSLIFSCTAKHVPDWRPRRYG